MAGGDSMRAISIDHHVLSGFVLLGQLVGLVGGLYLAYDLFGGPRGPLRRLTQIISSTVLALAVAVAGYLALFLILLRFNPRVIGTFGSATMLGGLLGLGIGIGIGAGLGYALNEHCQYRYVPRSRLRGILYGLFIGAEVGGFGCAFYVLIGLAAGRQITWQVAMTVGFVYNLTNGYVAATIVTRFLLRRFKSVPKAVPDFDKVGAAAGMLGGLTLGGLFGFGYWLAIHPDVLSAVLFALTGAIIAAIGGSYIVGMVQRIQWHIEHLPARWLGIVGIFLLFLGIAMQSSSTIADLLDIQVR